MEFEAKLQELAGLILELKNEGCSGIKLSTEDQGASLEFIEFVSTIVIKDSLPIHVKIGGPDARNDIRKCTEIGIMRLIAPMVESPFGVHKFVTAVEAVSGVDKASNLILSINLESLSAYEKLDAILTTPEIKYISEIVVGVSDLAKSVGKTVNDLHVLEMVETMSTKSKRAKKLVRVGGLMTVFASRPDLNDKLLKRPGVDEINTACVAYEVKRVKDLKSAYLKALKFEIQLNELWIAFCEKKLEPFYQNTNSLKKILEKNLN